jgi:hypothetical protein
MYRSSAPWVASLLAASIVLAACGPSSSRYISDQREQVYLRVPRDWHEYEGGDEFDTLSTESSDVTLLSRHVVSAERADDIASLSGEAPIATMSVYQVDGVLNQRMSTHLARVAGSGLSFDPVLPDETRQEIVEVLRYEPSPGGAARSGSRVVYRLRAEAGGDWLFTYDMTTYFDPVAGRLYVLGIGCTTECFADTAEQIDSVATSWQIGK